MRSAESAAREVYDVFMSFRGTDTRQEFSDILYTTMRAAGIKIYRDDNELDPGQKIETILTAIDNSRICMPVFSKKFVSSSWCLREVERMANSNKRIIPIFYHVTTEDVKLETPLYKDQLEKLKEKHPEDQILLWEEALRETVKSKGRELRDQSVTDFVGDIVKDLSIILKIKYENVPQHVVGMDFPLESAEKLLEVESEDVRLLKIYGIGGSGKTTLAKYIFNKIQNTFDCCCFLPDIAGELSRNTSINDLLKRLLLSLDPKVTDLIRSASAINLMQTNFQKQKVLIVLDNVDKEQQIQNLVGTGSWFGPKSRIIVTTRDDNVLFIEDETPESSSRSQSVKNCALEMVALNSEQSLQLLCWHAFGKEYPDRKFEDLANQVLNSIGGLPLVLEVIGKLLKRKDESFWEEQIDKMKKIVNSNVKKILRVSFDALEIYQQDIFLDIACFFITNEVSSPKYMWKACGLYPHEGVKVLISRSLIKIENERFWMHDQLKILGREIVGNIASENCKGPICYRFYEQKKANEYMLNYQKGKENIVGLQIDRLCEPLAKDYFADLFCLRYLSMSCESLISDFQHPIVNLKWLVLHFCPENFDMGWLTSSDLVILDLSYSYFDENWQGWRQIQTRNLKVINLSYCEYLEVSPSFSKMVKLSSLNFSNCPALMKLSKNLCSLENLEYLSLRQCINLKTLPESFGKLKSLVRLDLSYTLMRKLPNSIGELKKLEQLFLIFSSMVRLPETFGDLESLLLLELSYSRIEELPNCIGRLKKLQELSLSGCSKIKRLPESLGDLESLVVLKLSRTRESVMPPTSIFMLNNLERLVMERDKAIRLRSEVRDLNMSSFRDLSGTSNTGAFPSSEAKLQSRKIRFLTDPKLWQGTTVRDIPYEYKEEKEMLNDNSSNITDDVVVHDLSLLLSSPNRDFLIRNNGQQVQIDSIIKRESTLLVLFSASQCLLAQLLLLLMKPQYKDEYYVFIFVSLDEDDESFRTHFSQMPWLAIPFSDSEKRHSLVELFKVTDIPHLVKVDTHGKAITGLNVISGRSFQIGKDMYLESSMLFKDQRDAALRNQSLTSLLVHGPYNYVLSPEGNQILASTLEGKIVGFYFQQPLFTRGSGPFRKRLNEVYKKLKRGGANFEIVSVHPNNSGDFTNKHADNFLILPMNFKRFVELLRHFVIKNLPTLVIIGSNGETLNIDAVDAVTEHGAAAYPFTMEKLAEIGWDVVGQNEAAWRKHSLRSVMDLHDSLEYVISSDGRRLPFSVLQEKVLGVYFAHPSQSCIEFTLELLDIYEKLNAKLKTFEVVLGYTQRYTTLPTKKYFSKSFGTLPWLSLESNNARTEELASYFKVSTLPSLVIFGKDGNIVNFNAVHLIRDYGVQAYPFTPEKPAQLANVKKISGEIRDARSLWPKKLQHRLHDHQLVCTMRNNYICDLCNGEGELWSYFCKDCDFDLHCKCALEDVRVKTMST